MPQLNSPVERPAVRWALVIASALATFAAFPPLDMGSLAWVSLVPLLLVLGQVGPKRGFLCGWVFGGLFIAGTMAYVSKFGLAPWLLLAVVLGLFYGLFGLLASVLRTHTSPLWRVLGIAAAWTLLEMARGNAGPLALTFGDLAYSQYLQTPLIQPASIIGHYGISFLMALLNAGIATVLLAMLPYTWWRPGHEAAFNRLAGRVGVACLLIAIMNFFAGRVILWQGANHLRQALPVHGVTVAAVQGEGAYAGQQTDTETALQWYLTESRHAAGANLIVWPETAINEPLNLDPSTEAQVKKLAQSRRANLLVGAIEDQEGKIYNSAYFYGPEGEARGSYRKIDLVMFGEFVPYRDKTSLFDRYPIRSFDYSPGDSRKVFDAGTFRFAPLICFEGIFPGPTREVVRAGAQVLVLITSDAWALHTFELQQHSNSDVFRAVEARRPLLRAATHGRSLIYDQYGNTLSMVDYYRNGVAQAKVLPSDDLTVYERYGDMPLLVLCILYLLVALHGAGRSCPRPAQMLSQ